MSVAEAGAVIIRYIDELEASVRHIRTSMEPMLGRALAAILENQRKTLGWDGEIEGDLEGPAWFAPKEWKTPGDDQDNHDLFIEFNRQDCDDGDSTDTWVGAFCEFAGSCVQFAFDTNTQGVRPWRAILRNETDIIDELKSLGFRCDPRTGELTLRVTIERDLLAQAFITDEFDLALEPAALALNRIQAAREPLDRLVAAIRKKA